MHFKNLIENIEKIKYTDEFMQEMKQKEIHSESELELTKIRMIYAREQILRLTMENKNLLRSLEKHIDSLS